MFTQDLEQIKKLLDDAYFAIEDNEEILKEANRPFINDKEKAKDIIHDICELVYALDFEQLNKADELMWDLKSSIDTLRETRMDFSVVHEGTRSYRC